MFLKGGYLAVSSSESKNNFLSTKFTSARIWIGGKRLVDDQNVWGWVDGSQFSFTNWAKNEPNNARGSEDCVMTNKQSSKTALEFGLTVLEMSHSDEKAYANLLG